MFDSPRWRVIVGAFVAASALAAVSAPAPSGAAAVGCFAIDLSFGDRMAVDAIDEASGLVLSRQMPGVMWTHNDHDAAAGNNQNNRIYAVNMNGDLLATVQFTMSSQLDIVPGATFGELEDISFGLGPGNDPDYLYLSDTGDNDLTRPYGSVYRFAEPVFTPNPQNPITIHVAERDLDATRFQYESFANPKQTKARNVEAMFVDPGTGDLFLFEKALHALDGNGRVIDNPALPREYSFVHRVRAAKLFPANPATVRRAAINGYVRGKFVTDTFGILAADISADGTIIALKNTEETFYWVKRPGDSVVTTFDNNPDAPCQAPFGMKGEGLAIAPTSDRFVAIREGLLSPIWEAVLIDQRHMCFGRAATIVGTSTDDVLIGTAGADVIVAYSGDDVVYGKGGADRICLGPGDDYGNGGKRGDRIDGSWGDDTIDGANGTDTLRGSGGRDTISGNAHNDVIYGGAGRDTLGGGPDNDAVYGEGGSDLLFGWTGADRLVGGSGGDSVDGGFGNDRLSGGSGTDSCEGGPGTDTAAGCEDLTGVP